MPKKYGLIYQGSKDKLADRILRHIPSADCFVDLFAGGCSMTHVALLSGRYRRVIANDVSDIPQVFVNAANGLYDNEDRWISREDFYRLRDKDPFVRLVWSFSNNLNDYIYGRDIEPFKKALHWAVYYRDPNPLKEYSIDVSDAMAIEDRYKRWLAVKHICENRGGQTRLQSAKGANLLAELSGSKTARQHRDSDGGVRFDSYQRANHISNLGGSYRLAALHQCGMPQLGGGRTELDTYQRTHAISKITSERGFSDCRLQVSERCSRLPKLDISSLTVLQGDYRDVEIPDNSVVYCDGPYRGTRHYDKRGASPFDYDAYYEWLRTRPFPVWVSEYWLPSDFVCIDQFRHRATISATKGHENNAVVEKLFLHEKWIDRRVQKGLFD